MLSVGLTGGIGSGKSAVAERLRQHGAIVIDSDRIAREVVEPGEPALEQIVARFGGGVVDGEGRLRRQALADIVFGDADALADLNAIMLPLISQRARAQQDSAPAHAIVVHDSPLLVEQGMEGAFDRVIVVDCPDDVRLDRLVRLRGMSEADARARMAAQASRERRLAVADFVVDNSGTPEGLDRAVDALWRELVAAAGLPADADSLGR